MHLLTFLPGLNRLDIFAVHSQDQAIPSCPGESTKLWDGYSLVFTIGNGYGHGQDLGRSGSCLRKFLHLPFFQCQGRQEEGECNYGFRLVSKCQHSHAGSLLELNIWKGILERDGNHTHMLCVVLDLYRECGTKDIGYFECFHSNKH